MHHRVLRAVFAEHGGTEIDNQGDSFFVALPRAPDAVSAADEIQQALATARNETRPAVSSVRR